jgi:rhodanese-related sulfurtransferase
MIERPHIGRKMQMKFGKALLTFALSAGLLVPGLVAASEAKITPSLSSVDVMHKGKKVRIQRAQADDHLIPAPYNKTSRGCPPFCIQPMRVVAGVETIGELETLGYLKRIANGDRSVLVVDSRTPDWIRRGTIPCSVNIPWNKINVDVGDFEIGTSAETLDEILKKQFGATHTASGWNFSKAKTLVMFCNGMWCPQSSVNIKTLTKLGYPVNKLKWYRGGMQDWVSVGLTTVSE